MSCTAWPSYKGESVCVWAFIRNKLHSSFLSPSLPPPGGRAVMMGYIWSKTWPCVFELSQVVQRHVSHCHLKVELSLKPCPECAAQTPHTEHQFLCCIDRWYHVAAGLLDCQCWSADGPTWCLFACWTNLHSSTGVSGNLEILASQWERLLLRGGRNESQERGWNAAPLCYCAAVVGGEQRRADERRGVYLKWHMDGCLFLERANYLTAAPTVCVRACVYLCVSLSQQESGRCGPLFPTYHRVHQEGSVYRERSELKGWRAAKQTWKKRKKKLGA